MHVVFPLRASLPLLQIDVQCSMHGHSTFYGNCSQEAVFRSSDIALAVPSVLPACANTLPCMRPSRTAAFSCRESEQEAAHTADRPRNHPAGLLWEAYPLPYTHGILLVNPDTCQLSSSRVYWHRKHSCPFSTSSLLKLFVYRLGKLDFQ